MYTIQELQPLILEWAKIKDLLHHENESKQRLKLIEECGELSSAILKNDIEKQTDGIGDVFIVLTILEQQIKQNPAFSSYRAVFDKEIDNPIKLDTTHEIVMILYKLIRADYFSYSILNEIAFALDLDLAHCANMAWNEIKDRKGETINGTFIKNK